MDNNCPACGHKLDEQGVCHTASSTYVCYYRKDPNGDHYLVVSNDIDPETNKLEYHVEHPNGCLPVSDNDLEYESYDCMVQEAIYEGYADDAEELDSPGRYLIEPWSNKSWTDYGWEHDGGVYLYKVKE